MKPGGGCQPTAGMELAAALLALCTAASTAATVVGCACAVPDEAADELTFESDGEGDADAAPKADDAAEACPWHRTPLRRCLRPASAPCGWRRCSGVSWWRAQRKRNFAGTTVYESPTGVDTQAAAEPAAAGPPLC